jgi:hypothetical protein
MYVAVKTGSARLCRSVGSSRDISSYVYVDIKEEIFKRKNL